MEEYLACHRVPVILDPPCVASLALLGRTIRGEIAQGLVAFEMNHQAGNNQRAKGGLERYRTQDAPCHGLLS